MRPRAACKSVHIIDGRVEHALLLEVLTDEGVGHPDPQPLTSRAARARRSSAGPTWIFDLDNTLHDAVRTSSRTSTAP